MTAALLGPNGAESLKSDIERLKALDIDALRVEWRNLFGKRLPKALPKSLLVKALTYQLQAMAFGDLEPQTLRVLEAYAAKNDGRWRGRVRVNRVGGASSLSSGFRTKPGSILVREWAGELHRSWPSRLASPGTALPIAASRRSPARSLARDGTARGSSGSIDRTRLRAIAQQEAGGASVWVLGLGLSRFRRKGGARRIAPREERPRHDPPISPGKEKRGRERKIARVALRHLYSRFHRPGTRAGLQLARRPA